MVEPTHSTSACGNSMSRSVKIPMMPKGVEHKRARLPLLHLRLQQHIFFKDHAQMSGSALPFVYHYSSSFPALLEAVGDCTDESFIIN